MTISTRTRKLLWGRSGNRCAICRSQLIQSNSIYDDESIIGDEAHIVARNIDGPRGDHNIPIYERENYDNLILLCKKHHKIVDDQTSTYSVHELKRIKKSHEDWVERMLSGYSIPYDYQHHIDLKEESEWSTLLNLIKWDITRQITDVGNPLRNQISQIASTERTIKTLLGKRLHYLKDVPKTPFSGNPSFQNIKDNLTKLNNHKGPLKLSIHSMMVGIMPALFELKNVLESEFSIVCGASSSPLHLKSINNNKWDFIITADAGVYLSGFDLTKHYRRVITVWEEGHLALSRSKSFKSNKVLVAEGTTQEIHYRLGTIKKAFSKDRSNEKIESLYNLAHEKSFDNTILLTTPKAQRFIKDLGFQVIDEERSAMTFGLYAHKGLPDKLVQSFLVSLLTAYNFSSQRFLENDSYWQNQLSHSLFNQRGLIKNYRSGVYL